jgi:hypothetical protein
MAPEPWARLARACVVVAALTVAALTVVAPSAHALRIVDYNATNYPSVLFPARQPYFRTVLAPLNADIVVCQEFQSQAGVDSFRTNVLNVIEPGQWASATFFNGNDTDNALFYKPSKVQIMGAWAFYPNPANLLRLVAVWRVKPLGYTSGAAEFRIYSQHLKASTGSEAQRLAEATGMRDSMNAMPPGSHAVALGDWNFYKSSTEPGYWKLQENQANNIGRVYDPLNPTAVTQDWHDNPAFAGIFTQCPCVTCPSGSGFSGGGLDDRFDQMLFTENFRDGAGYEIVPGSYIAVGQDGLHWNLNITDPPTIPEGATYANALWNASDHLPIRIDIQLPPKISVSGGPFAFGTVILGAAVTTPLTIGNVAVAPASTLNYTLAAPAGFSVPAGPFTRDAVPGSNSHDIALDTATPGVKGGLVTISSDDFDTPTFHVGVSGTVLRHAAASLDSTVLTIAGALDFGVHDPGEFTDLETRLHNLGYDALQAQLAVTSAAIVGGGGRFTLTGGTAPITLAGVGETYDVHFDDTGATRDSLYEATLVFQSTDQALPGAVAQPDVQVALQAKLTPGSPTGVGPAAPTATRLYAPFPNPLRGSSTLRFDLATAADVRLEVFDLSGRRVSTIVSGELPAGRYTYRWNGADDQGGGAKAGLYFVRLSGTGLGTQMVRLAVMK